MKSVKDEIWHQLRLKVWKSTWSQAGYPVIQQVIRQVENKSGDKVWNQVWKNVWQKLHGHS